LPYAAYPFGVAQGSARQLSPGHRSLAASREGQPGVDSGDDQPLASLFFAGLPGGGDNDKIALNPASRIRRRSEDNPSVRFLKADEEARHRN
jgi:hypothetical protein